jgi:hypothetical protein
MRSGGHTAETMRQQAAALKEGYRMDHSCEGKKISYWWPLEEDDNATSVPAGERHGIITKVSNGSNIAVHGASDARFCVHGFALVKFEACTFTHGRYEYHVAAQESVCNLAPSKLLKPDAANAAPASHTWSFRD